MKAYFLLSKDNGLVIKDFIDSLKQAARDNEPQMMKARAEDERNKLSYQNFFVYDDTGERRRKTMISKVRVRVEIEK